MTPADETGKTGSMILDIQPSIPEVGKIKIGRKGSNKTKSGFRLPEKLDYFVLTTLQRDSQDDFVPDTLLMERLAEEQEEATGKPVERDDRKNPKLLEIPVSLLGDDIEDSVTSAYSFYSGRKRMAVCDGRWCTYYYGKGEKLAPPRVVACNGEHNTMTDKRGNKLFKPHTTVGVVIRGGSDGMRFGGVHKFRTTSLISLQQILGSLKMIQSLTRGFLANVPLVMALRPMQVSPDGKSSTVYVVHFELRAKDLTSLQGTVLQLAEAEKLNAKALSAAKRDIRAAMAREEDAQEQGDAADEFHPGQEQEIEVPAQAALPPAPAKSHVKLVETPAAEEKPVVVEAKKATPPEAKPPKAEPEPPPKEASGAMCSECGEHPPEDGEERCDGCLDMPF